MKPNSVTPISRRSLLLQFAVASLLPLGACASDMSVGPPPVVMNVVDRDSGRVLALYDQDGRGYVAGRPGSRYAIRLANQTGRRVLVVLSVDGVNAVSGETANWHQTGYVLDPYASYDIAGWRKSDSAVAAFEFAALRDSYAARTGRPHNVGVMGMAVFFEKVVPRLSKVQSLPMEAETADTRRSAQGPDNADVNETLGRAEARQKSAAAPAARAMPAPSPATSATGAGATDSSRGDSAMAKAAAPLAERLGTAHGRREWSEVVRTSFERASRTPQAQVEIHYDSYANLVAAGIIPPSTAALNPPPRAFPGREDSRAYVPDAPSDRR